jgi:hypothetical protein
MSSKAQKRAIYDFLNSSLEAIRIQQIKYFGEATPLFLVAFLDDHPIASSDACPIRLVMELRNFADGLEDDLRRDDERDCENCDEYDMTKKYFNQFL